MSVSLVVPKGAKGKVLKVKVKVTVDSQSSTRVANLHVHWPRPAVAGTTLRYNAAALALVAELVDAQG